MWNDTDIPLAYLITFRSRGTWLHGDERGSVSRFRNEYNSRLLPPEPSWLRTNTGRLKQNPVILDAAQKNCVEAAARETCQIRKWFLHAVNARTNHVHLVAAIGKKKPEIALNAFKANATRMMRLKGCWRQSASPWADKGSTRYLWNEKSVARATGYVLHGQRDELPDLTIETRR